MLMCLEQRSGKDDMSHAVKREITQVLQEGHGADKGVAVADSCCFFDFEACEKIDLCRNSFSVDKLNDDDIAPLCTNLGRFKRLKEIDLVSGGVCARGSRCSGVEWKSGAAAAFERVTCGFGRYGVGVCVTACGAGLQLID
jgi:hypothetical protein